MDAIYKGQLLKPVAVKIEHRGEVVRQRFNKGALVEVGGQVGEGIEIKFFGTMITAIIDPALVHIMSAFPQTAATVVIAELMPDGDEG